jgi:ANTAR domain
MTSDIHRQTMFAGDDVISKFDAAQYSLGDGPTLLAFTSGHPVLVPDITSPRTAGRWPGLAAEFADLPMAAVFCFPMRFGVIQLGVCAFYRTTAGDLTSGDLELVLDALELTTLVLLQLRGKEHSESLLSRWLVTDRYSRPQVHQATGMLMGQLGVSAETAFARLRAHAFLIGDDIEQVAQSIVSRRLLLEPDRL